MKAIWNASNRDSSGSLARPNGGIMHDEPIQACPVCGNKNLKASERQLVREQQPQSNSAALSYRCENGHVIMPSSQPGASSSR